MDLRKIQYFFAVIEHGNLSSAAQSLRVSQPTLSRQIQAIEDQFQAPLFIRGGRGMMLTEAGKQLHEGLQSIERQLRLLKTDVAAVSLEPAGEVAFGIPPSPRGLIAVPLVKAFNATYPRIVLRLIEETSGQLRDLVANVRDALRLKLAHDDPTQYNAVQRILYIGVLCAGVLVVLSGLAIWKPVQLSELLTLFYDFQTARLVHFLCMAAFVGFVVVHVTLALLVPHTLVAMVTGGPEVGAKPAPKVEAATATTAQ